MASRKAQYILGDLDKLRRDVRRAIEDVDEELEAAPVDDILGLP